MKALPSAANTWNFCIFDSAANVSQRLPRKIKAIVHVDCKLTPKLSWFNLVFCFFFNLLEPRHILTLKKNPRAHQLQMFLA